VTAGLPEVLLVAILQSFGTAMDSGLTERRTMLSTLIS
jgi:hypothetical protein